MDKLAKRLGTVRRPASRAIALTLLTLAAPAARADLHFQATTIRLGEVRTGAPLVQRFAFRNDEPEAVAITEARADCSCLAPRLAKWVYRPGEAGELLLEVHTLSQFPGPHTWTVFVRTRQGTQEREQPLRLQARVVSEIAVQPAALTIFADTAVGHDLTLTDLRAKHLTVTGVESTAPHLTVRLTGSGRAAAGPWSCGIHLQVEKAFPPGRHEEAIHLYTSDSTYADLKVPVTIVKQVRQRVTALPGEVRWEMDPTTPLPSQLVRLRDRENEAVVVEQVTADDPALTGRWAPGPGPMATLRIMVDGKRLTGGKLQSAVHVKLRQPVRDTVTIPVWVGKP